MIGVRSSILRRAGGARDGYGQMASGCSRGPLGRGGMRLDGWLSVVRADWCMGTLPSVENRRAQRRSEQHLIGSRVDDDQPSKSLDPDVEIAIDLAKDERDVILSGLMEWGGSARPTEELVIAMGFASLEDFDVQCARLMVLVRDGRPLRPWDWRRVLISTEVCFISDLFGAGWD
jgi:hypothetical protein